MKNLIAVSLFIICIISLWTTTLQASEINQVNVNDYIQCVNEVESQHKGQVSIKDYNDMIDECAFESEVELDEDDKL